MALSIKELEVGWSHESVVVDDLTRTQLVQYAGASGDYNPLHTDEVYATQVAGYPSVFAHGMLTMAMAARMLTDLVGDDRLVTFGGRFVGIVWPGDRLVATASVTGLHEDGPRADFDVMVRNGEGDTVFAGYATTQLDS